jgi:hypothetical protein
MFLLALSQWNSVLANPVQNSEFSHKPLGFLTAWLMVSCSMFIIIIKQNKQQHGIGIPRATSHNQNQTQQTAIQKDFHGQG